MTNFYCLPQLSPLHMAAGQGDPEKVEELVNKGADINAKDPGSGVHTLDSSFTSNYLFEFELGSFQLRQPRKVPCVHSFCNHNI